ncbi:MAG: recombinase RecT [Steroidobacteraceae bacterium]|nr:recombinase RecT [Steroidobacteraceae bacterium]MDW8259367.1 recombinase RecT [Gammaproteobacteria bacterium]
MSEIAAVVKTLTSKEMSEKIRAVLPADVPLERFLRVTLTALQQTPQVLQADRQSLYMACLQAAARGLMPDGREGILTVFNQRSGDQWVKTVRFLPMVEGVIKELAKGGVKAYAVSVYANDEIRVWNDDHGQHVLHEPMITGERGERVGALAVASDAAGRTYVEYMRTDELDRIAALSKSRDKDGNVIGPWRDARERMEQKTVLHRLRKRIPILSTADDDADEPASIDMSGALIEESGSDEQQKTANEEKKAARPRALQAIVDQEGS